MSAKSSWLSLGASVAALFWTVGASAHQNDSGEKEPTRYRAPTYDPSEFRSDQFLALELRIGPYRPNVDSEFEDGSTPFEDSFGTGSSVAVGLEIDWQALRIPYFGSLGPGFGWNFVNYSGYATFASSGGESRQRTSLWVMPMYAVAVLRVDVFAREWDVPLVPYGKVGLGFALWDAGESVRGRSAQGSDFGPQFHLGGMLHLNSFAPQAALDMDNTTGVNHAYLFFEWFWSDLDSFGTGMQVGTSSWVAGLAIEY